MHSCREYINAQSHGRFYYSCFCRPRKGGYQTWRTQSVKFRHLKKTLRCYSPQEHFMCSYLSIINLLSVNFLSLHVHIITKRNVGVLEQSMSGFMVTIVQKLWQANWKPVGCRWTPDVQRGSPPGLSSSSADWPVLFLLVQPLISSSLLRQVKHEQAHIAAFTRTLKKILKATFNQNAVIGWEKCKSP